MVCNFCDVTVLRSTHFHLMFDDLGLANILAREYNFVTSHECGEWKPMASTYTNGRQAWLYILLFISYIILFIIFVNHALKIVLHSCECDLLTVVYDEQVFVANQMMLSTCKLTL